MRSVCVWVALCCAPALAVAQRGYFPLEVGNQWVLQSREAAAETLNIAVEQSRVINGNTYFLVTGYAPGDVWIRETAAGEVYALGANLKDETLIAHLQVGAPEYVTPLSGCQQHALPASWPVPYYGPGAGAETALALQYRPDACRDVGIENEIYLAAVGLAQRSITTLRGGRTFDLVYAKVGGQAVIGGAGVIVSHSDLSRGTSGWLAGFSDYSLKTGDLRMAADVRSLPVELNTPARALFVQGMNRSDDLFMYVKKELTTADGLRPNQAYQLEFDITFASNAAKGCAGAGGAPGESVYLKAGATPDEPVSVLQGSDEIRLNTDKGEQATGGVNAGVAGNISNGVSCEQAKGEFVSVTRNYTHDSVVQTDERGSLWLIVGTDSAYEGLTELYYQSITARLVPVRDDSGPSGK